MNRRSQHAPGTHVLAADRKQEMMQGYHISRPIGTDLDAMLAPLDDVCRGTALLDRDDSAVAYELALLSAELIGHGSHGYLVACLADRGIDPGTARTIARAFSGAIERVAGWTEQTRRME
jgi:hypothetical protein